MEVESYLRRKFEGQLSGVDIVEKEDLDMVRGGGPGESGGGKGEGGERENVEGGWREQGICEGCSLPLFPVA